MGAWSVPAGGGTGRPPGCRAGGVDLPGLSQVIEHVRQKFNS